MEVRAAALAPVIYVSSCPLNNCKWHSDALVSLPQVLEARRAHLSGHTHGELVEHAAQTQSPITEYEARHNDLRRISRDSQNPVTDEGEREG